MKFDGNYVSEGMAKIIEQFQEDYEAAELLVDIDCEKLNNPDILDLMDFLSDTADIHLNDKMVRQCILGKPVQFKLDGENIGTIILNNITDSWAVFPVINDYPKAYKALADIVAVHLLKKSMLPRKKGTSAPVVAKKAATAK